MGLFSDYTLAHKPGSISLGADACRPYGLGLMHTFQPLQPVAPTLRDELQAEVDAWLKDVL